MSKHRYRGRRSEFPGIVVRLWGEWHRITRPPYGIQLVRETRERGVIRDRSEQ